MESLPIIIAVVGVIATIFAYVFGSHSADTKVLALKEKLDDSNATSKPKASVSKKAPKKKKTQQKKAVKTEDSKKLSEVKDSLKKLKGQLHSAKDEIKSLKEDAKKRKKTSRNTNAKKNSDVIFSLREEVGELKSALENAKLKTKTKAREKAPVEKTIETEGLDDASKKIVDEIEAQHREKLKKVNDKHRKLEKESKSKLRKASSNVDKQRRRADNNDRAYKITQRQVDVLQERIAFLEKGENAVQIAAPGLVDASTQPKTKKLPATKAPESMVEEIDDAVPGGLEAPSEPTTIEMSPDLADELFKPSTDESDIASPSSIAEESTRQTLRLDDVRMTNQLEIPDMKKSLAEPSAVDEAWAEFDVD